MKVGFTGTRFGCTPAQGGSLARWFRDNTVTEFHFGVCTGADMEATWHCRHHHTAADLQAHPPVDKKHLDMRGIAIADFIHPAKDYLVRNKDIVNATDVLVACPKGPDDGRGGTWHTIRYARRMKRHIFIIWPDGAVTEEGDSAENQVGRE